MGDVCLEQPGPLPLHRDRNDVIQCFGDGMEVRDNPGFRTDPTDATFPRKTRGCSCDRWVRVVHDTKRGR